MQVLLCTIPDDQAEELARRLLEARLIGCANLLPRARSLYWWEGEIQDDTETVLFMETTDELAPLAIASIEQWHPYDVPKIVALEVANVNGSYRAWLGEVTADDEAPEFDA